MVFQEPRLLPWRSVKENVRVEGIVMRILMTMAAGILLDRG
jgi:ABC-type nitrate/sulfonate/bicarbonate transport system ATPase subunit